MGREREEGREEEREREREKCRVQEGEIAMFCLPARGAREEEERKRRERGCEDRRLVFPSWSQTCQTLYAFRCTSALRRFEQSLSCYGRNLRLRPDLNRLEGDLKEL